MFFQIWRALFSFRSRYLDGLSSCSPSLYESLASNVLSIILSIYSHGRETWNDSATQAVSTKMPPPVHLCEVHTPRHANTFSGVDVMCLRPSETRTTEVLRYLKCAGGHASMPTLGFDYLDCTSAGRVTPYLHLVRRLLLLGFSESLEPFRWLSAHASFLEAVAWAIAARSNTSAYTTIKCAICTVSILDTDQYSH